MKLVAIVPARGGSKRLPEKNKKLFCGRPLLAWRLIQLYHCKYIPKDAIYVTTDDEEIAGIAERYGATVLMREDHRESLDEVSGGVPVGMALNRVMEMRPVDAILSIFCTSPLCLPGDLDRLVEMYCRKGEKMSVTFMIPLKDIFVHKRLPHNECVQVIGDKTRTFLWQTGGGGINPVPPDRKPYDIESESLIDAIATTDFLSGKSHKGNIGSSPGLVPQGWVEMQPWQLFEIDYPWEWETCEYYFAKYCLEQWEAIYEQSLGNY